MLLSKAILPVATFITFVTSALVIVLSGLNVPSSYQPTIPADAAAIIALYLAWSAGTSENATPVFTAGAVLML